MTRIREIKVGAGLILAAVLLMAAWIVTHWLTELYIDALWFRSLGYPDVYMTMLTVRLLLGGGAMTLVSSLLLLNLYWSYRVAPTVFEIPKEDGAHFDPQSTDAIVRLALIGFLLLAGVFFASSAAGGWADFIAFYYGDAFSRVDPIYDRDIGFYIFFLPVAEYVLHALFVLIGLAAASSFAVFYVRGAVSLGADRPSLGAAAFRHMSILGVFAAVALAGHAWLGRYNLLIEKRGAVFGAGYADVHAARPACALLSVATLVLALWLFINAFKQRRPVNVYVLAVFGVLWFLIRGLFPWAVHSFVVRPNEYEREAAYIQHNIDLTRVAYGLDKIEVEAWPGDSPITPEVLANYSGTIENLLLWSPTFLRDVLNQKQRIRSYYEFPDVDVDRYVINGKLCPVMISARELVHDLLPEGSRVWTNIHLQFTHGYGICLALPNRMTSEGLPHLILSNIPPEAQTPLQIDQPRLYFGERTNRYALVQTRLDEFDYPGDPENVFTRYAGKAGIPMDTLFKRMLLAFYTGKKELLFTRQITAESSLLLHRHIRSRLLRLAPFLSFDDDPYPVLSEGRVLWIIDAYTWSSRFPYSEPVGRTNYLRNSAKAVVDAYDGSVQFYCVDDDEPILRAYREAFPSLFRDFEEMPSDIRAHIRYPTDLFLVQTVVYRRYHVEDPQVFFNGEDIWTFPRALDSERTAFEPPRYIVMELPGSDRGPEFLLTRTFTVEGKDNMIAWIAAGCDGDRYGKLSVFRMPKRRNIYGPAQMRGRFNQDPSVSAFSTLMGQLGSTVLTTDVMPIPIDEGLLYLQSMFIMDPQVKIPELKQVVAGHGDRVSMAPRVDLALAGLFGEAGETAIPTLPLPASFGPMLGATTLQGRAAELYREARERLQAGDWAGFGAAFDALGEILDEGKE